MIVHDLSTIFQVFGDQWDSSSGLTLVSLSGVQSVASMGSVGSGASVQSMQLVLTTINGH